MELSEAIPGDRVYLTSDPVKELGTISEVTAGRVFVVWDRGRTWIYPSTWLSKASRA